ncbi:MAG: hypothetical protein LJE68_19625 [Rhodobacter sp.]|nr:hypothetical protein [Rhodobacter sp.]
MALFVAAPLCVLPMASEAGPKVSKRRIGSSIRVGVRNLRANLRDNSKSTTTKQTAIRDFRTGLRDIVGKPGSK